MPSTYQDLRVWQQAMQLALAVYKATGGFPREEQFGLTSQLRRAAVSISSNIAEGKGRQTDQDFSSFLFHARGSLLEVETQITLARELRYFDAICAKKLLGQCEEVGRSLAGLINSLKAKSATAGG